MSGSNYVHCSATSFQTALNFIFVFSIAKIITTNDKLTQRIIFINLIFIFYIQSNYDNNIYHTNHNTRNIYFHLPFTGLAKHIVEITINAQVVIFIFKCKFVYFKTLRLSQKIVQFSP